jgi:hypothetical protein
MQLLWGLLKILLWCAAGIIAYAIFANVEGETKYWLAFFVVMMGVMYEFQTIKEKLNLIAVQLDDLSGRRRSEDFVDFSDAWEDQPNKLESKERKRSQIHPGDMQVIKVIISLVIVAVLAVAWYYVSH